MTTPARALRIGLTGGIGSGKSTVAAVLKSLGAFVIDTDAISRQLTAPAGAAIAAIAAAFGAEFIGPDGALDRPRMRMLAFTDPGARQRLEHILHPMIGAQTTQLAEQAGNTTLVFDVPLLVESGRWRERVDKILVIDCLPSTQAARVMTRSGWTREAVDAVIAQQASRASRRACADAVIFNDGLTPAALGDEVRSLWSHWHP